MGIICIVLGFLALIAAVILIILKLQPSSELIGVMLGLFSVGLGCIAIDMSAKSDKKYSELLRRIDDNVNSLVVHKELDKIELPTGNIVSTPQPATIKIKTYTPETKIEKIVKTNREEAQKRLDEDTKKVGFVRGEVYQLENGSWGIRWGGKHPL